MGHQYDNAKLNSLRTEVLSCLIEFERELRCVTTSPGAPSELLNGLRVQTMVFVLGVLDLKVDAARRGELIEDVMQLFWHIRDDAAKLVLTSFVSSDEQSYTITISPEQAAQFAKTAERMIDKARDYYFTSVTPLA